MVKQPNNIEKRIPKGLYQKLLARLGPEPSAETLRRLVLKPHVSRSYVNVH